MIAPPDPITAAESPKALAELNRWLGRQGAAGRIAWALENTAGNHALSSSFGAQAAVSLHMATRQAAELPVILVDTGYLFPETHVFIGELRERLQLNLKVFQPDPTESWPEHRTRRLEALGADAIAQYNRVHKVEPMQRALSALGIRTWIAGLRRDQSRSRASIDFLELRDGRWKLHPLADWSDHDIWQYLQQHDLPYHPLWDEGYVSIGDVHSTRRLEDGMNPEETRFFGLKRECGLHFDDEPEATEEAA